MLVSLLVLTTKATHGPIIHSSKSDNKEQIAESHNKLEDNEGNEMEIKEVELLKEENVEFLERNSADMDDSSVPQSIGTETAVRLTVTETITEKVEHAEEISDGLAINTDLKQDFPDSTAELDFQQVVEEKMELMEEAVSVDERLSEPTEEKEQLEEVMYGK